MSKDMLDLIYERNIQVTQSTNQYHGTHRSTTNNTHIINNITINNITSVRDEPVEQKVCNESSTTHKRSISDSITDLYRMIF